MLLKKDFLEKKGSVMENSRKSNSIYLARFIALVCITCAHSSIGSGRLINSFANAGVAVFFLASGIYYRAYNVEDRIKSSKKILIPWFVFGSLTFILNSILINEFKLINYFLWLIGYNTYLWYLTVYLITMIFFSIFSIEKSKSLQFFLIAVLFISRIMTAFFNISGAVAFLNPFNWMGFVSAGLLLSQNFDELCSSRKKYFLGLALLVLIGSIFLGIKLDDNIHYFGFTSVFYQFAWCYLILYMTTKLEKLGVILKNVGRNSLPIYLVHIPIINWISAHLDISGILNICISTIIVLGIYLFFSLISCLISKNQKLYNLFELLTGFIGGK